MAVVGYMNLSHKPRMNVRLAWLKVVQLRHVEKERLLESFQKTPSDLIKMEKNQEDLDHHELNMVVLYVRFISVGAELVGCQIEQVLG